MLRSLTSKQFLEWKTYNDIEPFGEERQDIRFALLASVIAGSAGAKTTDGKPYTADSFLQSLNFDKPAKIVTQPVEQMEYMLEAWIGSSNKIFQDSGVQS